MTVTKIITRYSLIKRAEKILADIDKYFDDADEWGLSLAESDPDGLMQKMRKGLIDMLVREGKLKLVAKYEAERQQESASPGARE